MATEINTLVAEEIPGVSAKQQLLDLINASNASNVSLDDVDFSAPEFVFFSGRNSKIVVRAKASSPYAGEQDFYYNRLALSNLGYVGIVTDEPLSATKLLEIISQQKKVDLLADEFENLALPVLEQGDVLSITLKTKEQAVKWHGQVQVDIAFGLPSNLAAFHSFLHVTLPSAGYLL